VGAAADGASIRVGPDLSGLGPVVAAIAVAVVVIGVLEWLLARIWWAIGGTAVLITIAVTGFVALSRWTGRPEARSPNGGAAIPPWGVPVTVSLTSPASDMMPAFRKALIRARTRLSPIRRRTRSTMAQCDSSSKNARMSASNTQ
jgi:hypothetical protein